MSRHHSRAVRPLFLALVPVALLLGGGWWWFGQGKAPDAPTGHIGAALPSDRSVPDGPEQPDGARELAAVGGGSGRTAETVNGTGAGEGPPPVAFDAQRPLRGRVVPSIPLPADETVEVIVGIREQVSDEDEWSPLESFLAGGQPYREVARVRALADGTFEAPRPLGVARVQLSLSGDYVCGGSFEYDVGAENEPDARRFDIDAVVGAHVTLRLGLGEIANAEEVEGLVGHRIEFWSTGRSDSNVAFMGTPYTASGEVTRDGLVVLKGLPAFRWSLAPPAGSSDHQDLAPFLIASAVQFEPDAGTRVEILVPMRRAQPFDGTVVDRDGAPIQGARVSLAGHWAPAGRHGAYGANRTTDEQGRFTVQAFPDELDEIKVDARGFIRLEIGPAECTARLAEGRSQTFTLESGGQLRVHVSGEGGLPVSGLELKARRADGAAAADVQQQRTDGNGDAHFVALPAGPLELSGVGRLRFELQKEPQVRHAMIGPYSGFFGAVQGCDPALETLWYVRARVADGKSAADEPLQLLAHPAPTVQGTITGQDPAWSDPLRVVIFQQEERRRGLGGISTYLRQPSTFAVDPGTGSFSGRLAPGVYSAFAVSGKPANGPITPGAPTAHSTPVVEFEVGTEEVELALAFAADMEIAGLARLGDGTPLPGVAIHLSRSEGAFYQGTGAALTDEAGRFQFDVQTPGTYNLRLNSPHHVQATSGSVQIAAQSPVAQIELVAARAGAVRVAALGSDGAPRADAAAKIARLDGKPTYARAIQGTSDWAGAMGPLAPGSYVATVEQDTDSATILHREAFEIVAGEVAQVAVRLGGEPVALVSGVATSGGEPAAGLKVWLSDARGTAGLDETDAQGRYTVAVMNDGGMTLSWGPYEHSPLDQREVVISLGPSNLEAIVLPTGAVEGKVGDGLPITSMPVIFRAGDGPGAKPYRRVRSVMNGRFRVDYLPDGAYRMTVGRRPGQAEVDVPAVEFEIENGGRVRGLMLKAKED